jgi:surface antigen
MTGFAHHLTQDEYASIETDADFSRFELMPEERIGTPIRASRARAFLRSLSKLAILVGLGWGLYQAESIWPGWRSSLTDSIRHLTKSPQIIEPKAEAAPTPPPAELAEKAVAIETAPTPPDAAAVENPAADPTKAQTEDAAIEAAALAEPPPRENPKVIIKDPLSDQLQKRAAAVGLSPDLSRVLLTRLSDTDFRNASFAIDTAFRETPDSRSYEWPRKAKAGEATFRVHFVQGAARNCRRYVVTITKDGWTTTAPAMQKCGARMSKGSGN